MRATHTRARTQCTQCTHAPSLPPPPPNAPLRPPPRGFWIRITKIMNMQISRNVIPITGTYQAASVIMRVVLADIELLVSVLCIAILPNASGGLDNGHEILCGQRRSADKSPVNIGLAKKVFCISDCSVRFGGHCSTGVC